MLPTVVTVLKGARGKWCGFEILKLLHENRGGGLVDLPHSCVEMRTPAVRNRKYKSLRLAPKCPKCCSGNLGTVGALQAHLETSERCTWSYNLWYAAAAILAVCSKPVPTLNLCRLIFDLFDINVKHEIRLTRSIRHKMFVYEYGGWALNKALREWAQSAIVWPPQVRSAESANQLRIHPLSLSSFQLSVTWPGNSVQFTEGECSNRLTSSHQVPLTRAEPTTDQNKREDPVNLRDQRRQPTKRRRIQRIVGNTSAKGKGHSPLKGAESRNMFTGAVGNAELGQRSRVPFDPVRDVTGVVGDKEPGQRSRVIFDPVRDATGAVGNADPGQRSSDYWDPVKSAILLNQTLI
ncbi:hypothetical protein EDB80DRAFT_771569 [Ilyonectria destructans]|nr:hypothetical protein EDB80DRAFT_771569 [Ilyonectria destructans]